MALTLKIQTMKNLIIAITAALVLLGCGKDDNMATPDKISNLLSTNKAAYNNAAANTWVEISAQEYLALSGGIVNSFPCGTTANDFNVSPASSPLNNVTVANSTGGTIEPNHYLFAFKYLPENATGITGAEVIVSNTQNNMGFVRIGSQLPPHDAGTGPVHFVLKGNSSRIADDQYIGIYAPENIKLISIAGLNYQNGKSLASLPLTGPSAKALYQGLITDTKQWP